MLPDRAALRAHFPALAAPSVLLDNAGGSQVPACVPEAVARVYREHYAQTGGAYPPSASAAEIIARAHQFIARQAGAPDPSCAILASSDSILSRMLADAHLDAGGRAGRTEIILSPHGHESNVGPWLRLARFGFTVKLWNDLPLAGPAYPASLEPLLSQRTALVVFPHVSNILGSVVDVRAIADRAHAAGARVVVDGVAYAPHRPIDIQALNADYYAWSTYKVLGPHAAALVALPEALREITGPNHFFLPPDAWPKKFELGGVPHETAGAILGAQPYWRALAGEPPARPAPDPLAEVLDRATLLRAAENMDALERPLTAHLLTRLSRIPGLTIHGPADPADTTRVPTVAFTLAGRSSKAVATAANARGLGIRYGHFYSHRLVSTLLPGHDPEDGVLRISLVHYNTTGEIDLAADFLAELSATPA
ncbi:MAG: aminotransferase class V-fold PLP-dependent enzyme [Phycisphaerales bacterium]|jgi:cysteine desulfurase family protein (TIGR01976 family)|nr:aminotransferase class V-fold PLP-dependent enzyme [Phycisphaerales bacterium]